jgi:hypothetical protein
MPIEVLALDLAERWHVPPWTILQAAARDVVPFLEVLGIHGMYARAKDRGDKPPLN